MEKINRDSTISVFDVANFFLRMSAFEEDGLITNKRLQFFIYLAQAYCLAFHDKVLFNEPIFVRLHHPICPSLYDKYKELVLEFTETDFSKIFTNEQLKVLVDVWELDFRGETTIGWI